MSHALYPPQVVPPAPSWGSEGRLHDPRRVALLNILQTQAFPLFLLMRLTTPLLTDPPLLELRPYVHVCSFLPVGGRGFESHLGSSSQLNIRKPSVLLSVTITDLCCAQLSKHVFPECCVLRAVTWFLLPTHGCDGPDHHGAVDPPLTQNALLMMY